MTSSPETARPPVNTRRVAGRRKLHFDRPREFLEDVERVTQGPFRALGNLSAGQICMHLARTVDMSIDGIPEQMPRPLRWFLRTFLKRRLLTRPMTAGFHLPRKFARRLLPPEVTTEAGIKALREAVERLEQIDRRVPSPLLGPLTKEEWNQLHCRHAELHLSFLVPAGPASPEA